MTDGLGRPFSLDAIRQELATQPGQTLWLFVSGGKSEEPLIHWAVIYRTPAHSEMFKITKVDFDWLRKEGVLDAFP